MKKKILRIFATTLYASCSMGIFTLLWFIIIDPSNRDYTVGWLLMSSLPMLLTTLFMCRAWDIPMKRTIYTLDTDCLLAIPLAICACFVTYTILLLILMGIGFLIMTLIRLF